MERLKPHALEPGAVAEVLTTVDGESRWAPVPVPDSIDDLGDVDTSTVPPTPGQALVWDDVTGQWIPGTVASGGGSAGSTIQPSVTAARTTLVTSGTPYAVPLPVGIDSAFEGMFILVAHWQTATSATVDELLALPDWDVLAWTGKGPDSGGSLMVILGGDPRDIVTLAAGGGPCEFSILAVADVASVRSMPPQSRAPLPVNAVASAAGWSSPTDATVSYTATDGGYVAATAGASGTPYPNTAVLDVDTPGLDYTGFPIMVVEWQPIGSTANLNAYIEHPSLGLMGNTPIVTHTLPDGWLRTSFDTTTRFGESVQFVADGFTGSGETHQLRIRNIESHPSPNGGRAQYGTSSQVTIVDGVAMEVGDLFIMAGGCDPVGVQVYNDANGVQAIATESAAGNSVLTTRTWSIQPAAAASNVRAYGVNTGPQVAGLAAVGIALIGTSLGGGGASTLDELLDVDTTGATPGQVLTFDGTQWEPAVPPSSTSLTAEEVRDIIGAALQAGTGITVAVNDAGDTITISSTVAPGLDAEGVRDTIGAALVGGTGITVTPNDAGDQIVVTSTVSPGLTLEQIQDAVAAMLVEGTGIDLAYDDTAGTITLTSTGGTGGGANVLDELGDVDTTTVAPTAGQVLTYDGTQWEPADPPAGGGGSDDDDMNYRGTWVAGTYPEGAVVKRNGVLYVATAATSAAPNPPSTNYGHDFAALPDLSSSPWATPVAPVPAETITATSGEVIPGETVTTAMQFFGVGSTGGGDFHVTLTLTFDQAGSVSFYETVSSEGGWDFGSFEIDGVQQHQISGTVPWTARTYAVGVGVHVFKWRYRGDGIAVGSDTYKIAKLRTVGSVIGAAEWSPIGLTDAPALDALPDVDTTGAEAPGDGYVLTYDLASGQWVPRPGGGAVGSWENNQLVTFTHGTMSEATPSITVAGNVFPGSPQHTITVTEAMLASADKPVGFSQCLEVVFLFDGAAMTGATSSTLLGEATFGASTAGASATVNTTTSSRVALTWVLRDAQVGDVLTFKFRLNGATHGNVTCTARGATCYPLLMFRATPAAGGRWLYRDFVTGAALASPLVGTYGGSANLANYRYFDNDLVVNTSTSNGAELIQQTWIPGPTSGVWASAIFYNPDNRLVGTGVATSAASGWSITHLRVPSTIRYDRLAIPVLPT